MGAAPPRMVWGSIQVEFGQSESDKYCCYKIRYNEPPKPANI